MLLSIYNIWTSDNQSNQWWDICYALNKFKPKANFKVLSYLRNRSALAVKCWIIIHCLEVSCKEDQIMSVLREWFIFVQLTDKQWIITQQFTHWSWSISILTHNKQWSIPLIPAFPHRTEELPPIVRPHRIRDHVYVKSFKCKNNVTLSNTMNDIIFQ